MDEHIDHPGAFIPVVLNAAAQANTTDGGHAEIGLLVPTIGVLEPDPPSPSDVDVDTGTYGHAGQLSTGELHVLDLVDKGEADGASLNVLERVLPSLPNDVDSVLEPDKEGTELAAAVGNGQQPSMHTFVLEQDRGEIKIKLPVDAAGLTVLQPDLPSPPNVDVDHPQQLSSPENNRAESEVPLELLFPIQPPVNLFPYEEMDNGVQPPVSVFPTVQPLVAHGTLVELLADEVVENWLLDDEGHGGDFQPQPGPLEPLANDGVPELEYAAPHANAEAVEPELEYAAPHADAETVEPELESDDNRLPFPSAAEPLAALLELLSDEEMQRSLEAWIRQQDGVESSEAISPNGYQLDAADEPPSNSELLVSNGDSTRSSVGSNEPRSTSSDDVDVPDSPSAELKDAQQEHLVPVVPVGQVAEVQEPGIPVGQVAEVQEPGIPVGQLAEVQEPGIEPLVLLADLRLILLADQAQKLPIQAVQAVAVAQVVNVPPDPPSDPAPDPPPTVQRGKHCLLHRRVTDSCDDNCAGRRLTNAEVKQLGGVSRARQLYDAAVTVHRHDEIVLYGELLRTIVRESSAQRKLDQIQLCYDNYGRL